MKTPVSFKLREEIVEKLRRMSLKTKVSQTAILETLIENAQYTEPILAPKHEKNSTNSKQIRTR